MSTMKTIQNLCTPAYVYLVMSVISIILMMLQNAGNSKMFCLGNYDCNVESPGLVFLGQILYTVFWVFLLNWICNKGYKNLSWFLVLLPFLFFFIALGMFILSGAAKQTKKVTHKVAGIMR